MQPSKKPQQETRLAKCPWCGHYDALVQGLTAVGDYDGHAITCNRCGVWGPTTVLESEVRVLWNRFTKKYSERPVFELDRGTVLGLKSARRILEDTKLTKKLASDVIDDLIATLEGRYESDS